MSRVSKIIPTILVVSGSTEKGRTKRYPVARFSKDNSGVTEYADRGFGQKGRGGRGKG